MTTNAVSSSNAAAAVHAQQQAAPKHKPAVDFSKVMANAAPQPTAAATPPLQAGNGIKTSA